MIQSKRQTPPSHLGAAEKRLFREITKAFDANHFNAGDRHLLSAYCSAVVQHKQALAKVKSMGAVIDGANALVINPWQRVAKDSAASMASLATKLRLPPSSRLRTDHGRPSMNRAVNGKVFDPDSNWRDFQQQPEELPQTGDWREHQRLPGGDQ